MVDVVSLASPFDEQSDAFASTVAPSPLFHSPLPHPLPDPASPPPHLFDSSASGLLVVGLCPRKPPLLVCLCTQCICLITILGSGMEGNIRYNALRLERSADIP
jgi:hypothetical protein